MLQRLESLGVSYRTGHGLVDVMGRDEEKVRKAMERAISWGVPSDFIESLNGVTGVVAEIDTGRPGPTTACRFDMDCVCVQETRAEDHIPNKEGFSSLNPGLMHACVHDVHTSVGLSVVKWVAENKNKLKGKIRFIFQPAEEGCRGAYAMSRAGIVDDVDYFMGAHVGGQAKLGEIFILTGGLLASSKLDIEFTGQPSHAGSDPEKGRSALMAAACALMIGGIPRHSAGDSHVSVGTLVAGEGRNVTPVHAKMQVETRGVVEVSGVSGLPNRKRCRNDLRG